VRQVGYIQELNPDAWSTEHKTCVAYNNSALNIQNRVACMCTLHIVVARGKNLARCQTDLLHLAPLSSDMTVALSIQAPSCQHYQDSHFALMTISSVGGLFHVSVTQPGLTISPVRCEGTRTISCHKNCIREGVNFGIIRHNASIHMAKFMCMPNVSSI